VTQLARLNRRKTSVTYEAPRKGGVLDYGWVDDYRTAVAIYPVAPELLKA